MEIKFQDFIILIRDLSGTSPVKLEQHLMVISVHTTMYILGEKLSDGTYSDARI